MTGLGVVLDRPLGFVELDGVWVDDRRRCTWGLCDASFAVDAGATVAFVVPRDQGAGEAVFDLLTGRRRPLRGRVTIDGIDVRDLDPVAHLRALAVEYALDTGERRLTVAERTSLVLDPTGRTLDEADLVVRFDAGFVVPDQVRVAVH